MLANRRSFTPIDPIPGEIVVRLSPDAVSRSQAAIPFAGDVRRRSLSPATPDALGLARIQTVFERYGKTVAVARSFRPRNYTAVTSARVHPVTPSEFTAEEQQAGLADVFELSTDQEADVELLCRELVEVAGVEIATPRYRRTTSQQGSPEYYLYQWGAWRINCEDAWELQTGSSDVIVAIIDSGVDPGHPNLQPNLLQGADCVTSRVLQPKVLPPGWQFDPNPPVRTNNSSHDDDGHGTHVAGIIGAKGNMPGSIAGIVWDCKLLPVRCMAHAVHKGSGEESSFGHPQDIADAIKWAADFVHNDKSVKVINLSLAGRCWINPVTGDFVGDPGEAAAIAYAQNKGCLIIAAVGNDGIRWPSCPASLPDVLGVGAVGPEDQLAVFSNWDKQSVVPAQSVDVVAPGVNILSTVPGGDFAFMDGTSQAAPHVSGLAAMLFSQRPDATAAQVAQAIIDSAEPPGGIAGWHPYYGHGRIDARRALDLIQLLP